jgi:hypothetical protein
MYNPTSYYKEFLQAYDMWWNLIGNKSANSISSSYSDSLGTAQSNFNAGKSAMIPYAEWAKYELESTNGGKLDFDIAMMKTPKATASSQDMNYMVGFGDSMIIPAKSSEPRFSQAVPRLYGDRRWLQDLRERCQRRLPCL